MPPAGYGEIRGELDARSKRTLAKLTRADAKPALRKALVKATTPTQRIVRQAARALPSKRSRRKTPGGSLRNAIANSVTRKIKISLKGIAVIITVVPRGGKSNLGKVFEGEISPWRHPTFGHAPEVEQAPEPFFYRTINEQLPVVALEIERALDEFEKSL
jgi:hypothetical protein